jgi:salicylate biosynthesis isochorismate synthase
VTLPRLAEPNDERDGERGGADRSIHDQLRTGLARAGDGLTAIAVAAPRGPAAALLALDEPAVLWAARDVDDVTCGLGAAVELTGRGPRRFAQIVDAAWSIAPTSAIVGGRSTDVRELAALGLAPRFVGGFAFAPGGATRPGWDGLGDAWFVLPRLTYRRDAERAWLMLIVDRAAADDGERWIAMVDRAIAALRGPVPRVGASTVVPDVAARDAWVAEVGVAVAAINGGELAKVVLARPTEARARGAIAPAAVVAALDDRHPECTRFAIRPRAGGPAFVGASPERLIKRSGRAVASEALAGTIGKQDEGDAARLLASNKDRGEHALVVDAIAATLGARCSSLSVPATPEVRTLRHLHHLRTTIAGTLRGSEHVVALVAAMHPTPAVGGTPTAAAIEFIAAHEPTSRGWYGAPVGWFDAAGDGEFAVAIRSVLIDGDRAEVWAGCGIVADSVPLDELHETWVKQRAVLGALGVEATP